MRILIVTRSFFPENSPRAFRATELSKEFARQGHEVVVLTLKKPEIHNDFERAFNVTINDLGRLRLKSPDFGNSRLGFFLTRAFYRLLSLSIEYPDIELVYKVKKALKGVKDYDLLVSIAVPYPIHWGVAWARTPKTELQEYGWLIAVILIWVAKRIVLRSFSILNTLRSGLCVKLII
jgi:hypothetical protein